MWSEYKGFKYRMIEEGRWQICLPSGFKSIVGAKNEDEVKAKIDAIG